MEHKRAAMLAKQRMQTQLAVTTKPVASEDSLEIMKAMKAVGATEEGDAVFGAEVNLRSQVQRVTIPPKYNMIGLRYHNKRFCSTNVVPFGTLKAANRDTSLGLRNLKWTY